MHRLSVVFPFVLLVLALAACGASPVAQPTTALLQDASDPLIVFAAASLTDAFEAIAQTFERDNPGVDVVRNFAGSQLLAAQLNEGASADVFASAHRTQLETIIQEGRVISGTEQTFARNRLVVVVPEDNPARLQTLHDLANPGIKLVLADAAVPVGRYSLEFLVRASALPEYTETYSPTVLANVVSYEDNVRAVLAKVLLGEADAGIVYTSDVALDREQVRQLSIPDELNTLAAYPIAPIADSKNPELARQFIDFTL
ncbi:MAG: molybdate ABC transporter substrate-binding protein, partial [Chloroflexales bacterium]|nr:molybdate ABC transporter substrate-binding protein [Chloroflexales bacterium]